MTPTTGQTAIVTGGASGIGAAVVRRLRKRGVRVVIFDLQDAEGAVRVDVTDEAGCLEAVRAVGKVDILVNSAGIVGDPGPFWTRDSAMVRRVVEVNLFGTMHMCQAVLPVMIEAGWGRVVNIASISGKDGNANTAAYSAAKAAVIGLTKSLGKETALSGVIVNAVAPSMIASPFLRNTPEDHLRPLLAKIPMERLGEPDEVAALIDWLASDQVTFSTGAVYDASGGRATY